MEGHGEKKRTSRAATDNEKTLKHLSRASFKIVRRTRTDVVPVRVVGRKLLEGAGFDEVDPGGDLELARSLEVGCVCRDEGLRAVVAAH